MAIAKAAPLPWIISALEVLWPYARIKKSARPPSLPGNSRGVIPDWVPEAEKSVGQEVETRQRANAAAGVLAAAELDGPACGPWEYVGLCPLHEESRPSFYVNTRKDVFYCHGCGQGGDLIRFVQFLARHLSVRASLISIHRPIEMKIDRVARTGGRFLSAATGSAIRKRSAISVDAEFMILP